MQSGMVDSIVHTPHGSLNPFDSMPSLRSLEKANRLLKRFRRAIRLGTIHDIQKVLRRRPDWINKCLFDKDQWNALHICASEGYLKKLKWLLRRKGLDINARDKYGYRPIELAICRDRLECTKILLAFGAELDVKTRSVRPIYRELIAAEYKRRNFFTANVKNFKLQVSPKGKKLPEEIDDLGKGTNRHASKEVKVKPVFIKKKISPQAKTQPASPANGPQKNEKHSDKQQNGDECGDRASIVSQLGTSVANAWALSPKPLSPKDAFGQREQGQNRETAVQRSRQFVGKTQNNRRVSPKRRGSQPKINAWIGTERGATSAESAAAARRKPRKKKKSGQRIKRTKSRKKSQALVRPGTILHTRSLDSESEHSHAHKARTRRSKSFVLEDVETALDAVQLSPQTGLAPLDEHNLNSLDNDTDQEIDRKVEEKLDVEKEGRVGAEKEAKIGVEKEGKNEQEIDQETDEDEDEGEPVTLGFLLAAKELVQLQKSRRHKHRKRRPISAKRRSPRRFRKVVMKNWKKKQTTTEL